MTVLERLDQLKETILLMEKTQEQRGEIPRSLFNLVLNYVLLARKDVSK